jgi:two-component system nitrogen regulation sensor histidine kinase NtrY
MKRFFLSKTTLLSLFIVLIVILSCCAAYVSYKVIVKPGLSAAQPEFATILLFVDLILVLGLMVIVASKIYNKWIAQATQGSSSKLQKKIVMSFILIAIIPTISVALFSTLFFNFGVQSWFNNKISSSLERSVEIAQLSIDEHQKLIKSDAEALSQNISYLLYAFDMSDTEGLSNYLTKQSNDRLLAEAILFTDKPFEIIAKSAFSFAFGPGSMPVEMLNGEVQTLIIPLEDRVRALVRISNNMFLLVSRFIDPKLLNYLQDAQSTTGEFNSLKQEMGSIQLRFSLIFIIVSIVMVIISIAAGIYYSSYIISPIINLVRATQRIRHGEFTFRVDAGKEQDEISTLATSFNLMMETIEAQRTKLLDANTQIDNRRIFIEAVISGVSAGIIVLDIHHRITLVNRQACTILGLSQKQIEGKLLIEVSKELEKLVLKIVAGEVIQEGDITLQGENKMSIIHTKVIAETKQDSIFGYIVTFDDITALVRAERSAAWRDVARKIAHEIKNPLTPINLANNRLVTKFSTEVKDPDNFIKYTSTIARHVTEIGNLIDEFVKYAKMPSPKIGLYNIVKIVQECVSMRREADLSIDLQFYSDKQEIMMQCDKAQVGQVITNLVKNAEEAIVYDKSHNKKRGKIEVTVEQKKNDVILCVRDNGCGFDTEIFDKLTMPYVTNKPGGNGLGLAIVKKILDDHSASLDFGNNPDCGAFVKIIFHIEDKNEKR